MGSRNGGTVSFRRIKVATQFIKITFSNSNYRAHGNKKTNRSIMASITAELKKHAKSWPFRSPVNGDEVPDYYKIIKAPMGK